MKRRSKRIILIVFLLLPLLVIALIVLPFVLNPEYFKEMAFDQMQRTFGSHITIGRTDLSLFPYPHIEVSEVVVKARPDAHAYFRAKFISLDLKIGELLRQKFAVKELVIVQPEVEIRRDRKGTWSVFKKPEAPGDTSVLASLVLMEKVVISDGRMTIIDETHLEEARGMVFEDLNLSLVASKPSRATAQVEVSGWIRRPQAASEFSLSGLVNLEPSSARQVSARSTEVRLPVEFNGSVKVGDLDLRQATEFLHLDVSAVEILGLVNFESQLKILPGQVGYEALLSDLRMKSVAGEFSGSANVSGLMADDLTISVSVQSSPIQLETVRDLLPVRFLSPARIAVWEHAQIGGTIQVLQATVTGSTHSDVGISVNGSFRLQEAYWEREGGKRVPEHVQGTMIVEPDRIRFEDFTGVYDSIPVRSANGLVLFKELGPWFEVEIQSKVDANRIVDVLHEIYGTKETTGYLADVSVVGGDGDLRLRFAGLLDSEEGVAFESGEYTAEGLALLLPEMPEPISNGRGVIRFSPAELKFENVNGLIGESQFRVAGAIMTNQRVASFDRFTIHGLIDSTFLTQHFGRDSWLSHMRVDGPVTLEAALSGPVKTPRITGELDFNDSGFRLFDIVDKQRGVPGSLEFDVSAKNNWQLNVNRVELSILPFRLSTRGKLRLRPTFEMVGRVSTGPIDLSLLPKGVTVGKKVFRSGILEVLMDVRGRTRDWRTWQPSGWIALTKGVADLQGLDTPMTNLFLRLKVKPTIAELKRVEFRMQESDVHLTGIVRDWNNKPEANVIVESSKFDLDLVMPKGERSPVRDALESLASTTKLVGSIQIDEPTYKGFQAKKLSAILKLRDGLVTVDRLRGEAYGRPLSGRIFIHLPLEKPAAIRASFDVKGLPLEQVYQSFGDEDRLVTGNISVRGKIQGHGRNPRGVLSTLTGNLEAQVEEGHVQRGTVLPRILTLLNLSTVLRDKVDLKKKGFPFNKVTATLSMDAGVMRSENIIVDSPIMKMTTAGRYDLSRDDLDLVAAVSPFGQYSEFLKKIPLFGRILAGERKGIATALFKIQGPLSEPDVRYLPVTSLKTGLTGLAKLAFDILANTIKLPADLLKSEGTGTKQDSVRGLTSSSVDTSKP